MKGRPPKPTAVKRLEGNRGKRRLPEREPHPDPRVPDPPTWLDDVAATEYRRLVTCLSDAEIVTSADWGALCGLCMYWSEFVRLATRAHDAPDGGNMDWRRVVKSRNEAWSNYLTAAQQFGLTPSSRVRLAVPNTSETPLDQLRVILNGPHAG